MSALSRAIPLARKGRLVRIREMKYIRVLPAELSPPNIVDRVSGAKNADSPPTLFSFDESATSGDTRTLPNISEDFPGFGAQNRAQRGSGGRIVDRVCETCGRKFSRKLKLSRKTSGRFCSHSCSTTFRRGKPLPDFITPESDKALRVRANGLVNKRLKLGWFAKPTGCMKCGKRQPLDSHHTDYNKPQDVYWLCRSCHMTAHHKADFLVGIPPFICDEKIERNVRRPFVGKYHPLAKPAPAIGGAS